MPKAASLLVIVSLLGSAACATGTVADDSNGNLPSQSPTHHDAGSVIPSGNKDSGTNPPPPPPPPPQADSGTTCTGTMCGGLCVDTTSDSSNCGSCGKVCPSGATCVSSACQCSTGTLCGGSCVDTSTDNNNCGKCGTVCTTSETCTAGTCVSNVTSSAPPQGSCSHSLCTSGSALTDGCDTDTCTSTICDIYGDTYCCNTSWDTTCIGEVTSYCSPYSCP